MSEYLFLSTVKWTFFKICWDILPLMFWFSSMEVCPITGYAFLFIPRIFMSTFAEHQPRKSVVSMSVRK